MKLLTGLGGAVVALMMAGAAQAADCDAGQPGARAYALASGDMSKDVMGLIFLPMILEDKALTPKRILKLSRACDRGDFLTRTGRYRLYGQAKDKVVRFAISEQGDGDIAFLTGDKGGPYYVVRQHGDEAQLLFAFRTIPDDALARDALTAVLDGGFSPVVGLNRKTGGSSVYLTMPEAPKSSDTMPRPAPGEGAGEPSILTTPDGVVFGAGPDDAMVHLASGFACPAALEGFRRDRAIIFDAADGGRDVACRFRIERSWITLYLTRLGSSADGEDVFATYSEQAREAASPTADHPPPLAVGSPPNPGFADFWIGPSGEVEGLWLVQIGDWFIKLRVTYDAADEDRIKALATALLKQARAQVRTPEI